MRLLIKGSFWDAFEAAQKRDILVCHGETRDSPKETWLEVPDVDTVRLKVVQWLCEPHSGTPYPVGTLLFYSETLKEVSL